MPPALRHAARYALPLALLAFGLVTMRTTDPCVIEDGGEPAFGFPFAWTRWGGSSGSVVVDAPALALDLALYLAAAVAVCAAGPVRRLARRRPRLLTAALWAPAALVVAVYAFVLSLDPVLMPVTFGDGYACARPSGRALHVGLHPL